MDKFIYDANFVRAVDGDTIEVQLDRGFSDYSTKRLRLADIDCPELRRGTEESKLAGARARDFVAALLSPYQTGFRLTVGIIKTKAGKERSTFGRYVAQIGLPVDNNGWSASVTKAIVDAGHAVWKHYS
jgi:endonuclease YncB( thermonuclease family)